MGKNSDSLPPYSTNNNIGEPLLVTDSVASTNNYAMELINNNMAQHGMAIFTHEQTHGKGQRGKQWVTTKGENIILSAILSAARIKHLNKFLLSMAMAIAANKFLNKYTVDENSVKWPNDLYWRNRKAGGILIENIFRGKEWQWAVVGIGININQTTFAEYAQRAVSVKQITGKMYDPFVLAKELCKYLQTKYDELITDTPEKIIDEYNSVLYKRNEKVTLRKGNISFECVIKGVTPNGQLITTSAVEQVFNVGVVQLGI